MCCRVSAVLLTTAALLVLVCPCTGDTASAGDDSPARRALLVGISSYNHGRDNDWWDLNSAGDITALASMLQRRFGFSAGDIRIVTDPDETTREGIITHFRT